MPPSDANVRTGHEPMRPVRAWRGLLILVVGLVVALAVWAAPRRVVRRGDGDDWSRPMPLRLPSEDTERVWHSPVLADGGSTLFCIGHTADGATDIYRSRRIRQRWSVPRPVYALNSPSNETGLSLAGDGQEVFFASDRPGGLGGLDIYRARRTVSGWSRPTRLPAPVNSPADDVDPFFATSDSRLYFASNRGESDETFDLLRSDFHTDDGSWLDPQPLRTLNDEASDERGPQATSDGFLYFVSNRSNAGDASSVKGFDLFRARRGEKEASPERLAGGLNSTADEASFFVSLESGRLFFSSSRDGKSDLFAATLEPRPDVVEWDTTNLDVLRRAWQPAAWATVAIAAMIVGVVVVRRWSIRPGATPTFFAASLAVHLLLLTVLAYWSLPTVVEIILTKIHEAAPGEQPFSDNQHQSHEDGQEAWEKMPGVTAHEAQTGSMPERAEATEFDAPDQGPLRVVMGTGHRSSLDPSKVAVVPVPTSVSEPRVSSRAPMTDAAPLEFDEEIDAIEPTEEEPVPPDRPLENSSADQMAEVDRAPVELSPEPDQSTESVPTDRRLPIEAVELPEELDVGFADSVAATEPMELRPQAVVSEEATQVVPTPTEPVSPPLAAAPPDGPSSEPSVLRAQVRSDTNVRVRAATAADGPKVMEDVEIATPVGPRPSRALDPSPALSVDLEEASPVVPATLSAEMEIPDAGTLERQDSPLSPLGSPSVPVPAATDSRVRLTLGELADDEVVRPTLTPLVSQLDRAPASATRVVYAEDSVGLQEMFTLRDADIRSTHIELFGGTKQSEEAVHLGLAWLAAHQNGDGSWGLNNFHANCKGKHANCSGAGNINSNAAATGLALLPFLAAGHTHQAGDYKDVVARGVQWLRTHQKKTGDLLHNGDVGSHVYAHSIATIAMCEVYGMTLDPELKASVEGALDFVVKAQHGPSGGWRYRPGQPGDTSVVGWAMMALKSGEMAGLVPPAATIQGVGRWLDRVEGNKPVGGHYGYQNGNANVAMTAEGLLCRQFMGERRNSPRMRAGADYLLRDVPRKGANSSSYYWYYGTQVMYHMQGDYWETWNGTLRDLLVETQVKGGTTAGTWDPTDQWEKRAGRIYSTSLRLLMLEVYYRHLPLYEQLEE